MSCFAITSDKPRHIKFIKTLQEHVKLATVIIVPKDNPDQSFTKEEEAFFPDCGSIPNRVYLKCSSRNLESDLVLEALKRSKTKVGFIFGAPLLSSKLYSIPEYGCVNIHTGLVQHYRGVDSSSWALYDNKLDLIGTTLHYIDDSIDAGSLIEQGKITIEQDDTPNKIFFKTCQLGFDLLSKNISSIMKNNCTTLPLEKRGKLYQKKDMTRDIKMKVEKLCRKRVMEYLGENYSRFV